MSGRPDRPWQADAITELRTLLVHPETPLRDAFERMQAAGHGLLVIGDDEAGHVLGTVTDSGLRRAALAHPALDAPVRLARTRQPVLAGPGDGDAEVRRLLVEHRLRAVAVVDGGRLVGVRSLDEFPDAAPPDPVAVVMVGGRGERLRPLTDKLPKPLLKIGGQSIVERIIRSLTRAGVHDVYLTVNYMAEAFEEELGDGARMGVRLHYVVEDEPLGSAGGLSLLPERPKAPLLVTNGDLITTVDWRAMFDFHRLHAGAITIAGVEHRTYIPYGVLRTAEHHLLAIDEKPERIDFVNAGMYVLEADLLRFVEPGAPLLMTDLIADVVADGLPAHVFPVLERWFDIGTPEEFEKVLLLFATGEEG